MDFTPKANSTQTGREKGDYSQKKMQTNNRWKRSPRDNASRNEGSYSRGGGRFNMDKDRYSRGGGRYSRGGGRYSRGGGRYGRGGSRYGRSGNNFNRKIEKEAPPIPNLMSEVDFPSLGKATKNNVSNMNYKSKIQNNIEPPPAPKKRAPKKRNYNVPAKKRLDFEEDDDDIDEYEDKCVLSDQDEYDSDTYVEREPLRVAAK